MEPNKNSSSMLNGIPPVSQENKKVGPIIGVLVIVLIIIIGALYFFGQKLNTTPTVNDSQMSTTTEKTSTSNDSASVINADLDAQLKDIDYSF